MRFTCLRENLTKGLNTVNKAIPIKSQLPILSNVLITAQDGRIKLVGTDLDTVITSVVGASVEEEGSITVPARVLAELLSNLTPERLEISLDKDILTISANSHKTKINGISSQDYPDLPNLSSETPLFKLNAKDFGRAIHQVGFSVASDSSRPVFTGIYMFSRDGKLYVVGSDGFRLSEKLLVDSTNMPDFEVVVPAKTILESARIMSSTENEISIYLDESTHLCILDCDDVVIATRIIDGNYPDYKRIIPTEHKTEALFNANDLFEAVKLTSVFSKETNAVTLSISSDGKISIDSSSEESGNHKSIINCELIGEPLNIVFNSKYLLDLLHNLKTENIRFHANDGKSPCLITIINDETFLHVMAPMHTS